MIVKIETYFEISGPRVGQLPIDLIRKVIKEKISSQRLKFIFKTPDEDMTVIHQLTEQEAFDKLSSSLSSKKL